MLRTLWPRNLILLVLHMAAQKGSCTAVGQTPKGEKATGQKKKKKKLEERRLTATSLHPEPEHTFAALGSAEGCV
jgi:hypothetical protein